MFVKLRAGNARLLPRQIAVSAALAVAVPQRVRARRRVMLVAARAGADDLLDEVDAVQCFVARLDQASRRADGRV